MNEYTNEQTVSGIKNNQADEYLKTIFNNGTTYSVPYSREFAKAEGDQPNMQDYRNTYPNGQENKPHLGGNNANYTSNDQNPATNRITQGRNSFDDVNNEIKQFLSLAEKKHEVQEPKNLNTLDDLIDVLNRLESTYSNIHTYLLTDNKEGLQNELSNSNIKMSMMCESLIRVLRDVSVERNNLLKSEEEMNKRLKEKSEQLQKSLSRVSQLEHEIEYTKRGIEELGRVIKDQKRKMHEYKDKADLEKRNSDSLKAINEELESLRKKSMEKLEVVEKESKMLRSELSDKESYIKKLKVQLGNKDKEIEEFRKKCLTLESNITTVRMQLNSKENALQMCNSELSDLINKVKVLENQNEDYKEKAAYYERLYEATNNQNEYLNKQLSKMISLENIDKVQNLNLDEKEDLEKTSVASAPETKAIRKKAKKYKREYKRVLEELYASKRNLGNTLKKYKEDIDILNEEKKKALLGNNKIMETLMSRIEALMNKNREYKEQIIELNGKPKIVIGRDSMAQECRIDTHAKKDVMKEPTFSRVSDVDMQSGYKFSDMRQFGQREQTGAADTYKEDNARYLDAIKLSNIDSDTRRGRHSIFTKEVPMDNLYNMRENSKIQHNFESSNKQIRQDELNLKARDREVLLKGESYGIPRQSELQNEPVIMNDALVNDSFKTITDGEVTKEENIPYMVDDEFYLQDHKLLKGFNDLKVDFSDNKKHYKEDPPVGPRPSHDTHSAEVPDAKSTDLMLPGAYETKLQSPEGILPVELPTTEYDNKPPYNESDTFGFTEKKEEANQGRSTGASSVSSVKTTSTLKNMLKKTEMLQERFNSLEDQLNKIRKSDESEPKKMHDQVKAYTDYYYSDYLDLSNESDLL